MDRIETMQAFVTVADQRGFAPAARKLGLSASAVTRMVAALEERVGARLLQRTTRSVMLTDAGERFLERARRILAGVEEAEGAVQAERTQPTGRLVVSAPLGFGRRHVTPLMSTYLKRYPDVAGDLRLSDRMVNLVEEGIDIAVRIGHLPDSSLVARTVGDMRRMVVASPDYLATHGEPHHPQEITAHRIVHFGALSAAPDWRFVENDREVRVACVPRFTTFMPSRAAGSRACWPIRQRKDLPAAGSRRCSPTTRSRRCRSIWSIRRRGCCRRRSAPSSIWCCTIATGVSRSDSHVAAHHRLRQMIIAYNQIHGQDDVGAHRCGNVHICPGLAMAVPVQAWRPHGACIADRAI